MSDTKSKLVIGMLLIVAGLCMTGFVSLMVIIGGGYLAGSALRKLS